MIPPEKYEQLKEDLTAVVNKHSLEQIFGAHDVVVADTMILIMALPSFSTTVNKLEIAYRADLSPEDREVYDQVFGKTSPDHADSADELPEDAEAQE